MRENRKSFKKLSNNLLIAGCIAFIAGCGSNPINNNTNTSNNNDKKVTFNIKIDESVFSTTKKEINVSVYNSTDLKDMENTNSCSVSYDVATKEEKISCPPGVTYKKVEPETFKFNLDNIDNSITVKSNDVKSGEMFRVQISGLSKDDCNSASGGVDKTAESETVSIDNLSWAVTDMACLK